MITRSDINKVHVDVEKSNEFLENEYVFAEAWKSELRKTW